MQINSLKSFLVHSVVFFATPIVAVGSWLDPSKASTLTYVTITPSTTTQPTLVFSQTDPDVLTGIYGVQYTLPSTGVSNKADFNLVEGTPQSVYSTQNGTYDFPVSTYEDAEYVMQQAAAGVANYFDYHSGPLYFGTPGNEVYYILYDLEEGVESACVPTNGDQCAINPQQYQVPEGSTIPAVLGSVLALGAIRKVRNFKKV
jgi:hypothetical protein